MNHQKLLKLVLASLLAALTCLATAIFKIPSPVNGYIHLGDTFVILSGILIGPFYGAAAAGIGSMLADILTGYAHYAIGTLLIKAICALLAGLIFQKLTKGGLTNKSMLRGSILGGIASGIVVIFGYFFFASLFLGKGVGAAASIPGNIAQAISGIVFSTILVPVLIRITKSVGNAHI